MRTVDTAIIGVGSVGRALLHIFETRGERLARDYGLAFRVVLAADSSGVAVAPAGFDPAALRAHKESRARLDALPGFLPGVTPAEAVARTPCDLLFESSPVNLRTGEPGLGVVRAALGKGVHTVAANKAPLVLAYHELHDAARRTGARLAFSATVCGSLPVINLLQRDLRAAEIPLLRGIFNSTSNFILAEMEAGRSFADALAEAQQRGLAETDPSLDVDGWDTANKLVIVANAGLGFRATLADVEVRGMRGVAPDEVRAARAAGQTIRLLATAERRADGSYALSVAPTLLPQDSFLGSCSGWEMGIEIVTDMYGSWFHKVWEREALPTAAAMLRDAVNILSSDERAVCCG